ncbi:MAG TPA: NUDIX domain-containing protein [Arachnia sp.]|nr:NUDIX domain-containing protein [Arachnia sp.]HMT86713.1 NUDIX domain-containing protein [Arachnia sp.]
MPVPQFILDLRRHVGTMPLWLMGTSVVVLREGAEGPEVLLVRRADNGLWALISGIVDPGENPSVTAVREAKEEAAVDIQVERMLWLGVTHPSRYDNGDICQYLDHGFRARYAGGLAEVGDDESTAVGWFPVDALPSPRAHRVDYGVRLALEDPRDVALDDLIDQ